MYGGVPVPTAVAAGAAGTIGYGIWASWLIAAGIAAVLMTVITVRVLSKRTRGAHER